LATVPVAVTRATVVYALVRLCGLSHKGDEQRALDACYQLLRTGELGDKAPSVGVLLALVERDQWDGKTSEKQGHEQQGDNKPEESEHGET